MSAYTDQVELDGRPFRYRVILSRSARRLRIRVGLRGVEVVQPSGRTALEAKAFLLAHQSWVLAHVGRVKRQASATHPGASSGGQILYRGSLTRLRIHPTPDKSRGSRVELVGREIVIHRGGASGTAPERSVELWIRKQARLAIQAELARLMDRLDYRPAHVYVRGQRTKWGSCSSRGNLSFNWRLVLAPDFVLRYIVTHEFVHLAVPDHSPKFWLTVQSLFPEAERARQWLVANGETLQLDRPPTPEPAASAC